ncbi:MAG: DUF1573 domain-containing protein [Bacteroidia bacterium]|nr:DUF1573 domain-containing protein [Bacteroidia bacterium]MDW8235137.1 DUF1573 domain-containing protein [Bacteroidia bacterium]
MRVVAVVTLLFAISCTTSRPESSQTAADTTQQKAPAPTARIEFDKMEHDFGRIREGEKASYRFKVRNPGNVPLQITDVKPSCGCTVPSWTKEPIPPGGEGYVEVVFDSQGRVGEQMKTVTVMANTEPPSHILRFRGTVVSAKQ